ncbi:MAG TPA: hypothetical protein VFH51_07650, partial [Myxococcota bacterium]|nr:hypothetical protein [Myxococcota bacterium]
SHAENTVDGALVTLLELLGQRCKGEARYEAWEALAVGGRFILQCGGTMRGSPAFDATLALARLGEGLTLSPAQMTHAWQLATDLNTEYWRSKHILGADPVGPAIDALRVLARKATDEEVGGLLRFCFGRLSSMKVSRPNPNKPPKPDRCAASSAACSIAALAPRLTPAQADEAWQRLEARWLMSPWRERRSTLAPSIVQTMGELAPRLDEGARLAAWRRGFKRAAVAAEHSHHQLAQAVRELYALEALAPLVASTHPQAAFDAATKAGGRNRFFAAISDRAALGFRAGVWALGQLVPFLNHAQQMKVWALVKATPKDFLYAARPALQALQGRLGPADEEVRANLDARITYYPFEAGQKGWPTYVEAQYLPSTLDRIGQPAIMTALRNENARAAQLRDTVLEYDMLTIKAHIASVREA